MSHPPRHFLLSGSDVYQSRRALEAIIERFRKHDQQLTDLSRFDLEVESIDTLKRALLTIPFLVTYRLFIITRAFSASKTVQSELVTLFEKTANSTVVVLYESKPCDKRLSLYNWMTKHGKVQDYAVPEGRDLVLFVSSLASTHGITIEAEGVRLLVQLFPSHTLQLSSEIAKVATFAKARSQKIITRNDIEDLCHNESEESLFALSDALRDGDMRQTVLLVKQLLRQHDPMLLAATLASQIRTYAKLKLAEKEGIPTSLWAKQTSLNPYVIKLAMPLFRRLHTQAIQSCYRELIAFDERVKSGFVTPDFGFLLLAIRLHVTLKRYQD